MRFIAFEMKNFKVIQKKNWIFKLHVYNKNQVENKTFRTSLAIQWLRPQASIAGGMGSIPGWGAKIPHATGSGQKINFKKLMKKNP